MNARRWSRGRRRFLARARRLSRQHELPLRVATRMVREDDRLIGLVERGLLSAAAMVREIRRDVALVAKAVRA